MENMLHLNWDEDSKRQICHVFPCVCSLPVFKEDVRELVKGSYDFFAISHFSTELMTHAKESS